MQKLHAVTITNPHGGIYTYPIMGSKLNKKGTPIPLSKSDAIDAAYQMLWEDHLSPIAGMFGKRETRTVRGGSVIYVNKVSNVTLAQLSQDYRTLIIEGEWTCTVETTTFQKMGVNAVGKKRDKQGKKVRKRDKQDKQDKKLETTVEAPATTLPNGLGVQVNAA